MPKVNVSVAHSLSQEEAKKRISSLMADSRTRFAGQITDVSESWDGYTDSFGFSAMGFAVTGKLEVQPAQVLIELDLPWAAYAFKSRIESEIVKHARELLV